VTVYTVYEPTGDADAELTARADRIAFVKEGFSWPALFVPALWLLYHRMWIELVLFVGFFSLMPWLLGVGTEAEQIFGWFSLGLVALFAFEANDLRGWALQRRGYRFAGIATGRDRIEAERAFFTAWLPQQQRRARVPDKAPGATPVPSSAPSRSSDGDEVIGSFPRA
jgi:hypothetical protein